MTTLIQNGFLCDPAGGREGQFDLLIQDGKIAGGKGARCHADQVMGCNRRRCCLGWWICTSI